MTERRREVRGPAQIHFVAEAQEYDAKHACGSVVGLNDATDERCHVRHTLLEARTRHVDAQCPHVVAVCEHVRTRMIDQAELAGAHGDARCMVELEREVAGQRREQ